MKSMTTYYVYENVYTKDRRFARNYEELYLQLRYDKQRISRSRMKDTYSQIGSVDSNDFRITFFEEKLIYKALVNHFIK